MRLSPSASLCERPCCKQPTWGCRNLLDLAGCAVYPRLFQIPAAEPHARSQRSCPRRTVAADTDAGTTCGSIRRRGRRRADETKHGRTTQVDPVSATGPMGTHIAVGGGEAQRAPSLVHCPADIFPVHGGGGPGPPA